MSGEVIYLAHNPAAGIALAHRVLRNPAADPASVAAAVDVLSEAGLEDLDLSAQLRKAPPVVIPISVPKPPAQAAQRTGWLLAANAIAAAVLVGLIAGHVAEAWWTDLNARALEEMANG